jgi:hypothetical protein
MRTRSPLLGFQGTALALTVAVAVVILFTATNVPIINAQQQSQQQPSTTSQQQRTAAPTQNETSSAVAASAPSSLFQSIEDGFKVQVPQGWVIHDMDNTGFGLLTELFQGYGVLAQLCPQDQQQQQALRNVGGSSSSGGSCQPSQEGGDIIHIIRYPNLGARLGFTAQQIIANTNNTLDNILAYEIQKLHEVGYRDIHILNSTYRTVNFDINAIPAAKVPAKLVEMTYTTDSAPNEVKRGYFISTVTNATPQNMETITGYSIFYEGNSATEAVSSGSLTPTTQLAGAAGEVFDSFELIAAEGAARAVAAAQATQTDQTQESNDESNNDESNNDESNNDDNSGGAEDCEGRVHGRGASGPCDDYDETADDEGTNGDNNDNDNARTNGDNNDNARTHGSRASGVSDDYDGTPDDRGTGEGRRSPGSCESC